MRRTCLFGAVIFCLLAYASPASGEIIELLDGTKINGTIVHYFEGVYSIDVPEGERIKIPKEKIKKILFELPPPRAAFSTPEKTFNVWKKAMEEGDIDAAVDCYALMYQGMVFGEMASLGTDGLKAMKEEIKKTKFTIKNTTTRGNTALLKVTRSYGDDVQTAEISFIKENGEWKMKP